MPAATEIRRLDEINTLPPLSLPLESSVLDTKVGEAATRSMKLLESAHKELSSSNEILTTKKLDRVLPNVAFEIMKLGIAKESETHERINKHLEDGQALRGQIHDLLALSSELTKLAPTAKELSPKAKALIEKLKKEGIELGLDGPISKEKISELKSEVGAQVDRLRSEVNILLSTKVNHLTQVILPALLDMMKKITQDNREAISRINERMSRG